MPTMSASPQRFHHGLETLGRRRWALWLLLAAGCGLRTSLDVPGTNPSASTGGAGGSGGLTGGSTPVTCSPACAADEDCVNGSCVLLWGGMTCAATQDCPSWATCCDGSDAHCDGTRLPTGDATNYDKGGSSQYVVSADGLIVTDTTTGLVWQRDGSDTRAGCITDDSNLTCTWSEAKAYCASLTLGGVSGWRLPAVMELSTIVEIPPARPSIDRTAFPNTPADPFWTSSPDTGSQGNAWCVGFAKGGSSSSENVSNYGVRCVRGSRCYPASRLVPLGGGLVRDTLTKLVWQQQASTTKMNWSDANTYCSSSSAGFRLPTIKELMSIVDLTVTSGPRINQAAFPNTPPEDFWTSSPSADIPGWVWAVMFSVGYSHEIAMDSSPYQTVDFSSRARCVR